MKGDVRVGISGWRYAPWRSVFYPAGLPQRSELAYASRAMRTIEINGSFYSLQTPTSYRAWFDATPDDFVFAVKGGKFITHAKKLRGALVPLANFFASGLLALGHKLGPILWQLPPQLPFDDRIDAFCKELPRTMRQAARLAAKHDARLSGRAWLDVDADRPLRHAFEVRHPTFDTKAFLDVLHANDVALCIADTAGRWPAIDAITTDFTYVRLHGSRRLYASGYTRAELDAWAERIERYRARGDVYVYFDNDVDVRAPFDAMNLAARFGQNEPVSFPRKIHREAARRRGKEEVRTTWDRWRSGS
jgi:uncharacterized protein YecE (DUF72 family)